MNASATNETIETEIFVIRGQRIMIDSHLASLYGVNVKALNQAVRRNPRRFPPEFMFQVSPVEFEKMRSQFVTASKRNIRHLPLAFTEHGIAMLSSILKSERAIQVNIAIIKAFIKLRHAVSVRRDLIIKVERLEGKIHLLETDVRFIREDVQKIKNPPERIGPQVKGFQKE